LFFFFHFLLLFKKKNLLDGGKILTVAELWRGQFYCGAKEFNCGGAATLNGPWRTLMAKHISCP
jgi:hypothetical protein